MFIIYVARMEQKMKLLDPHAGLDLVDDLRHRRLIPRATLTAVFGAPLLDLHLGAADGTAVHQTMVVPSARPHVVLHLARVGNDKICATIEGDCARDSESQFRLFD